MTQPADIHPAPLPENMQMSPKPFRLSVKAVVRNDAGECLAIRRSMSSLNNKGLWDLPGGKSDPGESMEEALRREVREETGLQVHLTQVIGAAQFEAADHVVAYMLLEARIDGGELTLSDEHDHARWMPIEQLPELHFPQQFQDTLQRYSQAKAT